MENTNADKASVTTHEAEDNEQIARNDNPRANENIRVRSNEEPSVEGNAEDVGSEITDGEDA
jgi:hypothetical protein